jgi:hypothetical protein
MAYIYKHTRLDTQEVFYIGIGSDNTGKYKRAHIKSNRSIYWKKIVNKCGYEIAIILDNLTWEEACEKEKELIKLYGRKDLNEGSLINMTDGGEGQFNPSSETREKLRQSQLGRKQTQEHIDKKIQGQLGKKRSNDTKEKMRESALKLNRKLSIEDIERLKKARAEKGLSLESRKKMSDAHTGQSHTEESKEKIRQSKLGKKRPIGQCPHCNIVGAIASLTRYHFDNCKKNICQNLK